MKKDKDIRKKGSFVSFLIKYYIGFTLAVSILIMSVFFCYLLVEEGLLRVPKTDRLIHQVEQIKSGDYDGIRTAALLGRKGYFDVLDEAGGVIYTSSREHKNTYTKGELACIPEYYSNKIYNAGEYRDREGKKIYLIMELDYADSAMAYKESGFAMLDENFRVLNCSEGWQYPISTKKEYQYLAKAGTDSYEIRKHEFITNKNKRNLLIIHTEKPDDAAYQKLTEVTFFVIPVFLFLYIILIGIFILWLNHKIKKPLALLNDAMLCFADGYREGPLQYNGPDEFVRICDSFNKMSFLLMESEAAKQKLDESKQKMLADISHDLKTPITVIQGYSKALTEGMIAEEKKDKYLNVIYHKANGLTDLINTFYDYSRLEHPDFILEKEETDLCEYCREYIAEKYEEIEMAGFALELLIPEEKNNCMIDRIQFRRALENILANALKHNPSGTTLFFIIEKNRNQYVLILGDNGRGIPVEMQDTIFDPFVVGDESRSNKQGSGLGLAIAKKIVEAHFGTITLVFPPEGSMNTEFKITLPVSYRW